MKVILLKSIQNLGKENDIKEVSDGYASNHLFPRKLAAPVTPSILAKVEMMQEKRKHEETKKEKEYAASFKKINGEEIILKRPANEKGGLYANLHISHVLEELKKKGIELPPSSLQEWNDIRTTGTFPIKLLLGNLKGEFKLTIKNM